MVRRAAVAVVVTVVVAVVVAVVARVAALRQLVGARRPVLRPRWVSTVDGERVQTMDRTVGALRAAAAVPIDIEGSDASSADVGL